MLIPRVALSDGRAIPLLGLGCMEYVHDPASVADIVFEAIKIGYRLFDTSLTYKTESHVGSAVRKAIAAGLVTREEMFVTTKGWVTDLRKQDLIAKAIEANETIGLGYIDLLLVHGPVPLKKTDKWDMFGLPLNPDDSLALDKDLDVHKETWSAMEDLVKMGTMLDFGVEVLVASGSSINSRPTVFAASWLSEPI